MTAALQYLQYCKVLWDALTKSWAFLSLSKYHVGACVYVVLVQH